MKQVYLKITILFMVFSGILYTAKAGSRKDSLIDKQAAAIQQRLLARIQENERLSSEGRASEASYVVVNDDKPVYFFKYFTSFAARKFWVDRGWWREIYEGLLDLTIDKDGMSEKNDLNKWIDQLKKSYLENTEYKDYKLYFVISGIYNYKDIDEEDPEYEWGKISTTSFNRSIKDNKDPGAAYSDKENKILAAILQKVQEDDDNKQLTTILKKEKYIIFYLFNFYEYSHGETIVSQGTTGIGPKISIEKTPTAPYTFVITGCYYSPSIDPQLIRELLDYNKDQQTVPDLASATGNIDKRNDYFTQLIRNSFTFFATRDDQGLSTIPCTDDQKLLKQLQELYSHQLPNSSLSAAGSLRYLSLETRKCLLRQLADLTFCADGANKVLHINYCENLALDLIASVPSSDKKALMDYLNDDVYVLPAFMNNINDFKPSEVVDIVKAAAGKNASNINLPDFGGKLNFTALVLMLTQFAYDVYPEKVTAFHTASDNYPCDWLQYDPLKAFNDNSANILATYKPENTIYFQFRGSDQAYCRDVDMYSFGNRFASIDKTKKPFDFIGIIPQVDLPFKFAVNGKEEAYLKQKIIVPSILLYWNIDKIKTKTAVEGLKWSFKMINLMFRGGISFSLKDGTSLLEKMQIWSKNIKMFNTIQTTIISAPPIKAQILKKEGGQKFLDNLDGLGKHLSLGDAVVNKKVDIESLEKLCDVIAFWQKCLDDPIIYTDANFLNINQPLSDFELGLLNDGIMSKATRDTRQADIDGLFVSIKDQQNFQAFRQFCITDPLTTVTSADAGWNSQVSGWQQAYDIANDRNMVRVIYKWDEFLVADENMYNRQMTASQKFIPKSFYDTLDAGKRVFDVKITRRNYDAVLVALEYFAKHNGAVKGSKYNIVDELTIYTNQVPCSSCVYALAQFRQMFPNVKLHFVTTTKLHP